MTKPSQPPQPQHHTLAESTEETGEVRPLVITLPAMKPLGLLGGVTGLGMRGDSLFPGRKSGWIRLDSLWHESVRKLRTSYLPCPRPRPHQRLREKRNPPRGADFLAFCDFLILKRAQLWRTQRAEIRHVTEVATVRPPLRG